MNELTALQKLPPGFIEIDLSGNLLSCNCECYNFFQWMSITKIVFTKSNIYQCVFDDGRKETLNSLESIISQLFSQCYSPRWLEIYIGMEVLTFFLITVFCLAYRMRHEIWYLYLRMKLNRQKLAVLLNQKNYRYTAFVSCDHRDAKYFIIRRFLPNLETQQTNFKFCIAQRDFIVGSTIIGNIMAAMHNSRKIIFIISQYFLTSQWCKEELVIAHQVNDTHHKIHWNIQFRLKSTEVSKVFGKRTAKQCSQIDIILCFLSHSTWQFMVLYCSVLFSDVIRTRYQRHHLHLYAERPTTSVTRNVPSDN